VNSYGAASVLLILAGLVPGAWFGWSWGRRMRGRLLTLDALDAGGWVYGLLAVYAFQGFVYLLEGVPEPPSWWLGAARLALGVLLDAIIVLRALAWRRLRRSYRRRSPQVGESPRRA
jgi:hypothetical protein